MYIGMWHRYRHRELLLSYGADTNAENLDSESVLHMSLETAQHGREAAERSKEITALLCREEVQRS